MYSVVARLEIRNVISSDYLGVLGFFGCIINIPG
jgi:hypothetical protein